MNKLYPYLYITYISIYLKRCLSLYIIYLSFERDLIIGACKPEIYRAHYQAGNSGVGAVLRQNFFLFGKPQFLLLRPSTDWMRLTHTIKVDLLYLKSMYCIY